MTTEPRILSKRRIGVDLQVTRFLTRFGDVTWFLDRVDEAGDLAENLAQGTRAEVNAIARRELAAQAV